MSARVVSCPDGKVDAMELVAAAAALKNGGLVVFPTETVYGLGIDLENAAAQEKVFRLKERDRGKPLTIHVADPSEIHRYLPCLPLVARRLIGRFLPGPLTLVLSAPGGKTLGFRCPANDLARELIRRSGVTVAATSVNRSGEEPAVDSKGISSFASEGIDVIFDAGPTRYRNASTVVSVTPKAWKILREGVLEARQIKEAATLRILLVCGGNTCRSPMTEGLLRQLLTRRLDLPADRIESAGYHLSSAGTAAGNGSPASEQARLVMREQGIDLSEHRSRLASLPLLREAHRVFTMTDSHRQLILHLLDGAPTPKVDLLDPDGRDVPDPFGGSLEDYRRTAARIKSLLERRLEEL